MLHRHNLSRAPKAQPPSRASASINPPSVQDIDLGSRSKIEFLEVAGAALRYRKEGAGPPLLLIHGSGGDFDTYNRMCQLLAKTHTVITYERRGCGGSSLRESNNRPSVIDHARDAAEIVRAAGFQKANIFGSSAGATVGLGLVTLFPEVVQVVVAHEPPLVEILPDAAELRSAFRSISSIEQQEGAVAAAAAFFSATGILGNASGDVLEAIAAATAARVPPPYHEVDEIISFQPDFDALITERWRIIIAAASAVPASMPRRASEEIARRLGIPTQLFPGNHFGYLGNAHNRPDEFAVALRDLLETRSATG